MNVNIKSVTLVRTLAIWGAFLTVLAVILYAAFLAIQTLFAVSIVPTWRTYLAFWVLFLILKVDLKLRVHP